MQYNFGNATVKKKNLSENVGRVVMSEERIVQLYCSDNSNIRDAYDKAVFNICLQRERKGYKTFHLCGVEPAAGTTSVVMELAISLSNAGWKTAILDGDMRKGNSYKRLNADDKQGLADFIRGDIDFEDMIYRTNWRMLDYIPCGKIYKENPLKLLYASRMESVLKALEKEYDFVLIDVPSINSSVDANIFAVKADATVLVVAMDGSSRKNLADAYEELISNNANVVGVIENKISLEEYKLYLKDYDYFNKMKFIKKKK